MKEIPPWWIFDLLTDCFVGNDQQLNLCSAPTKNTSKANANGAHSVGDFIHSRALWHPLTGPTFSFLLLLLLFSFFLNNVPLLLSRLFFSFFLFWPKVLSHRGPHCSKRPIHEAGRRWREAQRVLHTGYRAMSSALTPEGCVWAAPQTQWPRHLGQRLLPSPMLLRLLLTWPFC